MKSCPNYVCVKCINGQCPIALSIEYIEYGIEVIDNCDSCHHYKGCEDCYLESSEFCIFKDMGGKNGTY